MYIFLPKIRQHNDLNNSDNIRSIEVQSNNEIIISFQNFKSHNKITNFNRCMHFGLSWIMFSILNNPLMETQMSSAVQQLDPTSHTSRPIVTGYVWV